MTEPSPALVALTCSRRNTAAAISKVWEAGHAFAPIDVRLTQDQQQAQLERLQPEFVISDDLEIVPHTSSNETSPLTPLQQGDALVIETSGSTGEPKQVIHTHDSLMASAKGTSALLEVTDEDKWLSCLPFNHIGGLAVLLRHLLVETPIEVSENFDAETIASSSQSCSLVSLVQRQFNQLSPEVRAKFRRIVTGGGPISNDISATPNVINTYGLTETGSGIYYSGADLNTLVPGTEIKVTDSSEIALQGGALFRTYRNVSDSQPFDESGWFLTGDLGTYNTDTLKVTGRKSLLIRTGGEDVSPELLEQRLKAHPGIRDAAVGSVSSKDWGNAVHALIVPTTGMLVPTDALAEWIKQTLPAWYVPKQFHNVGKVPKTASGKVDRAQLATDLAAL